ncbi:MAG TPA: serine hydrolase [Ignavibacteria bacterium]|nr:serine hydrolase [Ignavibacteria bacterium]HMR39936.1 serine hydrolase [Ignavibacteria bacterium]
MNNFYLKNAITFLLFLLFTSQIFSQDKSQTIDDLVNKYYDYGQFNGSILVSENGKIILNKGYGYAEMEWKNPNTPDTKFRLASVSKQFTAMLIMQLVGNGMLSLDGKISEYLPYYRRDIGEKVTIRQLLTHSSGIFNYTDDPEVMQKTVREPMTVQELVVNLCSKQLDFEPGTNYSYSNSGYVILGAIIEEVTGKKYEDVLQENIFIPLNMKNSGYDHNSEIIENRASGYDKSIEGYTHSRYIDMSIPFSAGALYSTVNDMYLWDQALYTDKLVSKETLKLIFTPNLGDYGFGWHISDVDIGSLKKNLVTHSGGIFGFNTLIMRYPEDGICIVILNNYSNGNIRELGNSISAILYEQDYKQPKQSLTEILFKTYRDKGLTEAISEFNELKENKDEYFVTEREINNLGYNLLRKGSTDEAIELFKLNVDLFPQSANVYDSLGEAYLKNGNKDLAIINYRKSVELNPENESGKKVLSDLQGK